MELYWLVIFAVLLNSWGGVVYIKNTLKGKTKPNRVTWFIWALAPLTGASATWYSQGFVWSAIPVFMAGLITLLILLSSFVNKQSYWRLGKLDYFCFLFALGALLLWGITDNSLIAIVFAVLADFLAAIPLLIKMYKFPETETIGPFFAGLFANFTALFVIEKWILEEYLFPVYLVTICVLLIGTYYWKSIILKIKK